MFWTSKKINRRSALSILLRVFLLLLIAYEAYLLNSLYRTLDQKDSEIVRSGRVKIDTDAYKKASDRYNGTFNYFAPAVDVADPFRTAPKAP